MHSRELFVSEKSNNSTKVVCLSLNFISRTREQVRYGKRTMARLFSPFTFRYDTSNVTINYEIKWNLFFC